MNESQREIRKKKIKNKAKKKRWLVTIFKAEQDNK